MDVMADHHEHRIDTLGDWPADGLEAVPECPVCGSPDRDVLYEGLRDRVFFCASGEWTLHRCRSCGSAYLDPRPTPETIGLAYRSYFTHEANPEYGSLSLGAKLRRTLANGYRNWRYGTHEQPASRLGIPAAFLIPNARAIADATMRHLPKPKPGQRLLDLGCGSGAFLLRAQSAGWEVVGVDFDPKAVDVGRRQGLDVRLGGVEILDSENEQFDVITMSHVIEHVHHPVGVLRACYRLLKPAGAVWIETPNFESEGHRLFGKDWLDLDPPRHLVLFSLGSMRDALGRSGFSNVEILPYRPLCTERFRASTAIAHGIDPYSKHARLVQPSAAPKSAEHIAKREASRREFVMLIARKR